LHYVYILISEKDSNKYYVGITRDVQGRLQRHNEGHEFYTKHNTPWRIETYIAFRDRKLAYQFEKYLKHGSGHAFLKKRFLPEIGLLKYRG